ncbi:hypothetical protein [Streptomyces sp. DSM 40750]|nr:hypothetical protein [Streptomyces sp. DSM 40750]
MGEADGYLEDDVEELVDGGVRGPRGRAEAAREERDDEEEPASEP